jgi:hypothetical protein
VHGYRVARGAAPYVLATILLVAGGSWFFLAAPETGVDPALVAGRTIVERLLPDLPPQVEAETMTLAEGVRTERDTPVPSGSYVLAMACVGDGQVRVWLSREGADSGRAVPCGGQEAVAVELTVGLADEFFLAVSAETGGPAIFRWRVIRAGAY